MDIYIIIYIQYIHTHIIYNGFADQKYDIMWQSLKPKAPRREVFLFLPSQVGDGFPWRSPPPKRNRTTAESFLDRLVILDKKAEDQAENQEAQV